MQQIIQMRKAIAKIGEDDGGEIKVVFNVGLALSVTAGFDKKDLAGMTEERLRGSLSDLVGDLLKHIQIKDCLAIGDIVGIYDLDTEEEIELEGVGQAICKNCGSPMHGHYCSDDTCAYSEWPQRVPREELLNEPTPVLRERHKVVPRIRVCAEVHSDDRRMQAEFDAAPWFAHASDDEIVALAGIEWGRDSEADEVAQHFRDIPEIAALFAYVENQGDCGYECTIEADGAMNWLKQHRPVPWKRIELGEVSVTIEDLLLAETSGQLDGLLLPFSEVRGYSSELNVAWDYWHYGRHAEYAEEVGMPDMARLFSVAWQIESRVLCEDDPVVRETAKDEIRAEYPET